MSTSANFEVFHDTEYYKENRLPVELAPEHYKLTLSPDLKNFTTTGNVDIDFVVTRTEVSQIVLNASELSILDGHVVDVDNAVIKLKTVIYNDERETIVLKFQKDNINPRSVSISFAGIINDKMRGLYRSKFSIEGAETSMIATQFCSTDARRVFPCFDEPISKASFELTLIYDDSPVIIAGKSYKQIALSNGDLISEEKTDDGRVMAKFDTTPNMSTYLLAFVVGPMEFVEAPRASENDCRIRVYTTPGKQEQGRFALEVATKALKYYEDYFSIKYPLSKLDLVALPELPYGAMENWGLITYREMRLLYDAKTSSTAAKQTIAVIIAHEIAHQWFGNLVTMAWWNDLWLNEGFASFMQYLCADSFYPEWHLWSQFVSDMRSPGMIMDALRNSHPIDVPISRDSQVNEIFDDISYNKGCSILRMLHSYVGDDCFREGLNDYLLKFSYENTTTADLWDCLSKASKKPVGQVMSTWTDRIGYPWIKVDALKGSVEEEMIITLEQDRFIADGKLNDDDENQAWMVPVTIVSGSPDVHLISELMEDKKKSFVIPNQGDHWLKLNKDSISFHRTSYSQTLFNKLTELIRVDFRNKLTGGKVSLSATDRFGILDDYFVLSQAGHVQTKDLIKLLDCFQDETDYSVWRCIDNCISRLSVILRDYQHRDQFQAFARKLYQKIYSKLTWEPSGIECHSDTMLRSLIIHRLVLLRDKNVLETSKKLYLDQISGVKSISADSRQSVYYAVSLSDIHSDIDELFKIYAQSDSMEEKDRALRALAYSAGQAISEDQDHFKRVTALIFGDEVRNQDKVNGFVTLSMSNPKLGWRIFKDKHAYFETTFPTGNSITWLVKAATGYLTTVEDLNDVEQFFAINNLPKAERTIQQSLEIIRISASWLDRIQSNDDLKNILDQLS